MKRSFALCLLFFFILQCVPVWALAAGKEKHVRVTATSLNVRSGPGTDSPPVAKVTKGMEVEFVKQDGDWVQIKMDDGTLGWVSSKFVETVGDEAPATETPKKEEKKEPAKEVETAKPAVKKPASSSGGGGSSLGSVFKWTCILGAVATGGLAFNEHSQGNDAYDEYKAAVFDGDKDLADEKWLEADDHDSKAQTFGIVAGSLFGVFLIQQFVLGGDDDGADRNVDPLTPPLALDPRTGGVRASLVLARF